MRICEITQPKVKTVPCGDCFRYAITQVAKHGGEVYHGMVTDPWTGKTYLHAWTKTPEGLIKDWQTSQGDSIYKDGWPEDKFYKHYIPKFVVKYTQREAIQHAIKNKNYGPWTEDKEIREGWKDQLANLAVAGSIAGSGAIGMNYDKPAPTYQEPPQKIVRQVERPPKPAAPVEQPKQEQEIEVKPITKSPLEKVLMNTAKQNGIEGEELVAFMAQMAHESMGFRDMVENHPNIKRYSTGKTAKILGNKSVNDAERFIGRGFIQLTGRWNYEWMQKKLGIDLTSTWSAAHQAADPEIAAKIAVLFWKHRVQPRVNDFTDIKAVTKPINPSFNGMQDRVNKHKKYLQVAMADES